MKKLFNRKKTIVAILLLVVAIFVSSTQIVEAADIHWSVKLLGSIARAMVSVLGWILAKLMGILIYIAQYDNFTNAAVIINGWRVARDVANMFFVVILLIIAFGTILQLESYNYKKWLPKLILMAILINFSKTICGLLIDVSQVVMLTFVNAFSEIGAGSLTNMLGIADWQSLKGEEEIVGWEVAAAYVLAVIYAFIALATVAAMVGMLVMRIIMIWVYVVLSPFAYLLSAFPGGASYASRWWTEFTKNLIVGPILAFFIWLSFAALGTPANNGGAQDALGDFNNNKDDIVVADDDVDNYGKSDLMIQFIVSIAMLIGGMKIAQEIGGAAGGVAGKTFGKVKGLGLMGAGAVGGFALAKAKSAGKWTGKRAAAGAGTLASYADKGLGNLADKQFKTQKFGDKGLVGTGLAGAATFAGRASAKLKGRSTGSLADQELNKAMRDHYEASKVDTNAVMEYGDKKYRKSAAGPNRGRMVELDAQGNETNTVLQDGRGKEVKAMTASSAAWHDAKKQNFRSLDTEGDKKQADKVEASKKKFSEMNLNSGEIDRKLKSAGTSAVDKMALAMIKASKGSFKTKADVDEAKKYVGGNSILSDKFSEDLDAKRPDLNYDLDSSVDLSTLKKKMSAGKVDPTKLRGRSLENPKMLQTMQDHLGANFESALQTISKNGSADDSKSLSTGLLSLKNQNLANPNRNAAQNQTEAMKVAKVYANLNGMWEQSFSDQTGNLDTGALAGYIKSASAKNLNNMSAQDYDSNTPAGAQLRDTVRTTISAGQLSAMMKDGSNIELVKKIRDDILANNRPTQIIPPGQTQAPAPPKNYTDINANAELLSL